MAKASIRFKVVATITALLVASVAAFILLSVLNQRANLLNATRANLLITNDMLNRVVQNLMLSGEASTAIDTLEDIREIDEFEEVAIFRTDGVRAFSDYETLEFVNTYQSTILFDRTPRVSAEIFSGQGLDEVVQYISPSIVEDLSERYMEFSFPILNTAECRVCHGEQQFIRGVAHYRVSLENISNRIRDAGLLLTSVFVVTGSAIAIVLIFLMQRIIVKPVLNIGAVVAGVGEGNLDVSVPIASQDEIGDLSSKINGMISGLRDRDRLVAENAAIDARNRENRKYLDNIAEGLVLINRKNEISEQYSSFMEELFQTDHIAGQNFVEFVYPPDQSTGEEKNELEQFLGMVFNAVTTEMEMIQSINPLNDRTMNVPGKQIIFDVRFIRIYEGGEVQNVMAIFIDKTREVEAENKLDAERLRSRTEVATIAAVLKAGADAFAEFRDGAAVIVQELRDSVTKLDDAEIIRQLFRDVHSLKGEARYMEFGGVAGAANRVEDHLSSLRAGVNVAVVNDQTMAKLTQDLEDALGNVENIDSRFRSFVEGKTGTPSDRFARNITEMISTIADELGKEVIPFIQIEVEDADLLREIRDPIIHLVRNSLDHGLEVELERVAAGKNGAGRILVRATREDGVYVIEVSDDGRGIDFAAVEKRARSRGIVSATAELSRHALIRVLFSPDFSSRDEVTELSGRGVGLDAVYGKINRLGGRISVSSTDGRGTRFLMKVPKRSDA